MSAAAYPPMSAHEHPHIHPSPSPSQSPNQHTPTSTHSQSLSQLQSQPQSRAREISHSHSKPLESPSSSASPRLPSHSYSHHGPAPHVIVISPPVAQSQQTQVPAQSPASTCDTILHPQRLTSTPHDDTYTPKNILLTGGAGFIGSNVCCFLVKKYPHYKIIVLDKIDYCATANNFEELRTGFDEQTQQYTYEPNFKFVKGDILSSDLVNHIVKDEKIDTILHFAAQTHVDNSFGQSLAFTKANVLGTHVLLEAAIAFRKQIKRFIHVSTDEVYGEASSDVDAVRMTETSVLNPTNPYAATKVAAEFLVKSYHTSFGLPTIITRGNNVYGPKQYPEKIIPKFIYLLDRKQPCPIHGDGSNRRSYLYIDDVCEAFDVIMHRGKVGEIYNVGSDTEMSNLDVLRTLLQLFGLEKEEDKYVQFVQDRAFNDFRYWIDTSSLTALGWNKKYHDFKQGLAKTIAWYLSHRSHWENVDSALSAHPQLAHDIKPQTREYC